MLQPLSTSITTRTPTILQLSRTIKATISVTPCLANRKARSNSRTVTGRWALRVQAPARTASAPKLAN